MLEKPAHASAEPCKVPLMTKQPKRLGDRLKALRRARRGLTGEDAAAAIGISRSTLASIENGHDLPKRATLFAIAKFYGVTPEFLVSGGRPAPASPNPGEVVKNPNELALLEFWRGLSAEDRELFTRMLAWPHRDSEAA